MYFTGFADEAATGIDGQIEAVYALGWSNIEARNIDKSNLSYVEQKIILIISPMTTNEIFLVR